MEKPQEPHFRVVCVQAVKGGCKETELARTYPSRDAAGTYIPHPIHDVLRMAGESLYEHMNAEGADHISPNDIISIHVTRTA